MEGCSIRATVRMTGIAKKTVMRLLVEVGAISEAYHDRVLRNLPCRRLQPGEFLVVGQFPARALHGRVEDADTRCI